jgi:hypothetical protein
VDGLVVRPSRKSAAGAIIAAPPCIRRAQRKVDDRSIEDVEELHRAEEQECKNAATR